MMEAEALTSALSAARENRDFFHFLSSKIPTFDACAFGDTSICGCLKCGNHPNN